MPYVLGMTEDEHRTADIELRQRELALREREIEQQKSTNFWNAVSSVVTVAVPLITLLGLQAYFKVGRKGR